jgi:uncharacterized Ntn-hydrolase superfamily protein
MMRALVFCFTVLLFWNADAQQWQQRGTDPSTYSIIAWDSATGDIGIALQSNILSAGAILPFAKSNVGAVIVQGRPVPIVGARALDLLKTSYPRQIIDDLLRETPDSSRIQISVLDSLGASYTYTGNNCAIYSGSKTGPGYSVQGNSLKSDTVLVAMSNGFKNSHGDLAERLLVSLEAGAKAEGMHIQRNSASLLVVRDGGGYGGFNDRYIDLRVDDDSLPLVGLRRALERWQKSYSLEARLRTIEYFNQNKHFLQADNEKKRLIESMNAQIRLKPDDPEVLNNIAWTLATSNIDLERALELSRRAVRLEPKNLDYLNTMAECFYRLGGYEDAIAIANELISKNPTEPYYYRQLHKFKEGKQK